MPNTITISGFKEFGDKLNKLAAEFPQDLDDAARDAADSWAKLADRSAPIDMGKLHGGINISQQKEGVWDVNSPKEYSPYMEWGTKTYVSVPAELQTYAARFKGAGTGTNPKELIYAWVLRKGLGAKAQWPIFISIMKKGVRPHPFFFIHMPTIEKQLLDDLKQMIETTD